MSGRSGKARGPGYRSLEALRWLERLDVAGIEPFGLAHGFGRRATYSHVQRLADAGLVVRAFDRDGSVVAITAAGRRAIAADRGDVRVGATHGSGLRHARAVSWVAALATLRKRAWVSDREARDRAEWLIPVVWSQHRGQHRPDLGIEFAGGRVAVEVELSHKSPRRLQAILAGHDSAIASGRIAGGLIYVSDRPDVLAAVSRAATRVGLPPERFRTRPLEDLQREVRRLTREQKPSAEIAVREAPDSATSSAARAIGRVTAVDVAGRRAMSVWIVGALVGGFTGGGALGAIGAWWLHRRTRVSGRGLYAFAPLALLLWVAALLSRRLELVLAAAPLVAGGVGAAVTARRRRLAALGAGGELREFELARVSLARVFTASERAARRRRAARGERTRIAGQGELIRQRSWPADEPCVPMAADGSGRIPRREGRHLLIVGATGSGKTVSARRWLLARILADGVGVLATDPKGRSRTRSRPRERSPRRRQAVHPARSARAERPTAGTRSGATTPAPS